MCHAAFGEGIGVTTAARGDDEEVTAAFAGKGVKSSWPASPDYNRSELSGVWEEWSRSPQEASSRDRSARTLGPSYALEKRSFASVARGAAEESLAPISPSFHLTMSLAPVASAARISSRTSSSVASEPSR